MAPFVRNDSSFDSLRERSLLKAPLSLKDPVICSLSAINHGHAVNKKLGCLYVLIINTYK